MARYGLYSKNTLGVSVANIRVLAKRLGRDHDLALALWETGVYEARMLTPFVDEPTGSRPPKWTAGAATSIAGGFATRSAFTSSTRHRTPGKRSRSGPSARAEFVKRAAFALLASVALHDKTAPDKPFLDSFPLIERAATDNRNFVKKAVSWALRGIGKRNPVLHAAAVSLARRLAASADSSARWIGKDALRDLATPATIKRLKVDRALRRSMGKNRAAAQTLIARRSARST